MAKTREDYKQEQEEQARRDLDDLRYQGGRSNTTFNPERVDELTSRQRLDRDPRDEPNDGHTFLARAMKSILLAALLAFALYGIYGIVMAYLAA